MRINGKKYTLSKFSWLVIGILSTIIVVIIIYLIFFRTPKEDKIVDYLICTKYYTETIVPSDVTKTIKIGLNYEDKMVNNTITDIYYFKNKNDYDTMVKLTNSDNIGKNNDSTKPKYSFDKDNMTITTTVTIKKESTTYNKLPKYKNKLKEYYENEDMTCN